MKKTKEKVWCLVCGDVTNGHPEQDKILVEMLENGCSVYYSEGTN